MFLGGAATCLEQSFWLNLGGLFDLVLGCGPLNNDSTIK
jgi:hypothetical protein